MPVKTFNHPIDVAFDLYGIQEIKGKQDNPMIVAMFDEFGFEGKKLKDETAWCSVLLNWCCKVAGYPYTGKLNATSWLQWGKKVDTPMWGDLVVLWRGNFKGEKIPGTEIIKGHVGFFITKRNGYIWVLGGNQSNMLRISAYRESRLLEYRRYEKAA